jgi:hypothetical protein
MTCRKLERFCQVDGILLQPSPGRYEVDIETDEYSESFKIFLEGLKRENIDNFYVILFITEERKEKVSSVPDREDNVRIAIDRELISFKYFLGDSPGITLKDITDRINFNLNR